MDKPVKTVSISRSDARVKSILGQARFRVVQSDCEAWVNNSCTIGIAPQHPAPGAALPGRETAPITVSYTDGTTERIWVSATFLPKPPPAPPSTWLSIGDVTVTEGDTDARLASFTVTRSGATAAGSSVRWATSNGSATAASDYLAVPSTTLRFAAGETTKTVSVSVSADRLAEPNETFSVRLSSPAGATIADDSAIATITDDDHTYLAVSDATVTEGNSGTALLSATVTRYGNTADSSSVRWSTANSTAVSGSDYVGVDLTTLSFAPGEMAQTLSVSVNGDLVDEANETFLLRLSSPTGATIADDIGVVTIVDDEGAVSPGPATYLTVTDQAVWEGHSGAAAVSVTITRYGNTTGTSSVQWATADGSAVGGSDYTAVPASRLNWAAGETVKTLSVSVNGDLVDEADEVFSLVLSAPSGASLSRSFGRIRIVDDEAAHLAVEDRSIAEGDSGAAVLSFTVSRSGDASGPSSVRWATADGTAVAGSDYSAVPAADLHFAAGETSKTVSVSVNGDTLDEPHENFSVRLSSPGGASISDATALATIVDDDPTLEVNDVLSHGEESGVQALFTITRTGSTAGSSSVQYRTVDGSAVAGADYQAVPLRTVTFAPGERTKRIAVTVIDDTEDEDLETFSLQLSSATGATILRGTGTATLWDLSPG